jgi:hypothetical protein
MMFSMLMIFKPAMGEGSGLRFARGCARRDGAKLSHDLKKILCLLVGPSSAGSTFLARVGVIARMTDSGLRSLFGAVAVSGVKPPLISRPFFGVALANKALGHNAYVCHASCGARVAPATGMAHL